MKYKYLKDVVTLECDSAKCTGCGMCLNVCPHEVFTISKDKVQIINRDSCMECGACVKNCPFSALSVETGVGCAAAVINGILRGTEPDCDCSRSNGSCCQYIAIRIRSCAIASLHYASAILAPCSN